jgi:hypothetical protein
MQRSNQYPYAGAHVQYSPSTEFHREVDAEDSKHLTAK